MLVCYAQYKQKRLLYITITSQLDSSQMLISTIGLTNCNHIQSVHKERRQALMCLPPLFVG